ncbi:inhibitory regulator protein ira1-related [Anaeramoeba flamelloides]|uniref:Inhibitory regulator protein ira1-related n=1 Tax=Anaeramoeba flamelloides TaxID=1746091 RepID=A0ABQ8YRE3_9EUKA|nr:inhibitory regulator protein ira1-related [Anaeramoeba flamelloides]
MESPKKAIKEIVKRIQSFLPIYNYKTAASSIAFFSPFEVIQKNFSLEMETLMIFSRTITEEVCFELANLLIILAKQSPQKQDFKFSYLEQSFIIVMKCIIGSLEFLFKKSYLEIQQYSKTNKKKIFAEKTAKLLTQIMCDILFSREHGEYSEIIEKYSGRLFTFLSHANYQVLWTRIASVFESARDRNSEVENIEELNLMKYLDYDQNKLSSMLGDVGILMSSFKKDIQIKLSSLIRQAIWNWIDFHPSQFTEFCRSGKTLSGNPGVLFDKSLELQNSAKKKQRPYYKPLLTMLLVICPDTLLDIARENKGFQKSVKSIFLEELKTTFIKGAKLQKKIATQCLVDICRAATYVGKKSTSGLRVIAPGIERMLREKLFFSEKSKLLGSELFVEFLIASYRLSPYECISELFTECLKENNFVIYKKILVQTLLIISKEEKLEWNPDIGQSYSKAIEIKTIFYRYVEKLNNIKYTQLNAGKTDSLKTQTLNPNMKKKEREIMEQVRLKMEIVELFLKLFQTSPDFALVDYIVNKDGKQEVQITQCKNLITTLLKCLDTSLSNEITYQAINVLKILHKSKYIKKWSRTYEQQTFMELNSMIIYSISNLIINSKKITQEQTKLWLNLIDDLLKKRNEYFVSILKKEEIEERIKISHDQANTRLETALLMLLCNSDTEIVTQAIQCFESLCNEIQILDDFDNVNNTICLSYINYQNLTNIGQHFSSRIVQQKNIQLIFRKIENSTSGNVPAWTKIFHKFNKKTKRITKYETLIYEKIENEKKSIKSKSKENIDGYNQEVERIEWENYLGFLTSLATVAKSIVTTKIIINKNSNSTENGNTNSNEDNENLFPKNSLIKKSYREKIIYNFLNQIIDLIISDIPYIQETVVRVIIQMSSSVYHIFFSIFQETFETDFIYWEKTKKNIFEKKKKSEIAIRAIDQLISILKGIFEQPLDMDDLADVEIEQLFICIMNTFSKYIVDIKDYKIKIKMCKLIQVLMEKKEFILFKREVMFRNELVEKIMVWFSDFQKKIRNNKNSNIGSGIGSSSSNHNIDGFGLIENNTGNDNNVPNSDNKSLNNKLDNNSPEKKRINIEGNESKGNFKSKNENNNDNDKKNQANNNASIGSGGGNSNSNNNKNEMSRSNSKNLINSNSISGNSIKSTNSNNKENNSNQDFNKTDHNKDNNNYLNNESILINNEMVKIKKIWNEIDLSNMEAISKLLEALPLQKPWISGSNQPTGEEILQQKSNLFFQYFTFFTQLLDRLRSNNLNHNTNDSNINDEEEEKLSQLTVISLSNMIHANVSVGLHHVLPMGYVKHLKTRSEFIDVLTNILNQGTEFDNLKETLEDKYQNMIEMILDKDFIVIRAINEIIEVTDMDKIAEIVIKLYYSKGLHIKLLKFMIDDEVAKNPIDQPTSLFRRNSLTAKLLSAYTRLIGKEYIQKTLGDLIKASQKKIIEEKISVEIDPLKLKESDNLEHNLKNLSEMIEQYFCTIVGSVENIPRDFFLISNILKKSVEKKFENSTNIVIAGFFFLRFICPLIISPENLQIISDRLPVEVRRALILITKALQNLANGVRFGIKEEFMIPLNPVIDNNEEKFNQFVIQLSTGEGVKNVNLKELESQFVNKDVVNEDLDDDDDDIQFDQEINNEDLFNLHEYLYSDLQNLSVHFKRLKNINEVKKGESFVLILTQLGKPTEDLKFQNINQSKHNSGGSNSKDNNSNVSNLNNNNIINNNNFKKSPSHLNNLTNQKENMLLTKRNLNFINKNKNKLNKKYQLFIEKMKKKEKINLKKNSQRMKKKLQSFSNFMYIHSQTKKNQKVVYFILRNSPQNCDYESILYYGLTLMKPIANQPYIILFDCTLFGNKNEIPKYWCNQFLKHIPYGWSKNLQQLIILNPSNYFKKYVKKNSSLIPNRVNKMAQICSCPSELKQFIYSDDIKLPLETLNTENEIISTFNQISQQSSRVKNTQVIFKFTSKLLEIIQLKQSFFNKNCNLIDFIKIGNIKSVSKTIGTQDQFMINMIIGGQQKNINYKSSQYVDEIVNTINTVKEKYTQTQKTLNKNKNKIPEIRPSDIPGSLLNVALLNLGSSSESLRKSSYNLVTALCNTFNFALSGQMLEAEGLTIPQSHTSFVVNLSTSLATYEKQITLEFLNEITKHYQKASIKSKHLCLEYMSPWFVNLKQYIIKINTKRRNKKTTNSKKDNKNNKDNNKDNKKDNNDNDNKKDKDKDMNNNDDKKVGYTETELKKYKQVKKILINLLNITLIEKKLYPAILVHVWKPISEVHELLDLALNVFIMESIQRGVETNESELIAQVCVTVATQDCEYISMKICDRILRRLYSASHNKNKKNKYQPLEQYQNWDEILVLTRFLLYLSFENLICLEATLPELFHFILISHCANSYLLRTWLISLVINIVHSLATKLPPENEKSFQDLNNIVPKVTDTRFRVLLSGRGQKKIEIFQPPNQTFTNQIQYKSQKKKNTTSTNLIKMPKLSVTNTESIGKLFFEIMNCYSDTAIGKEWLKRWNYLTQFSAFDNSSIQSRAFVVFGVISNQEIKKELINQILKKLYPLLIDPNLNSPEILDLINSLLICLTHLYPLINQKIDLTLKMFWIAILFLELGELSIFPYALDMLNVIFNNLKERNVFERKSLKDVFMQVRLENEKLNNALSYLEKIIGVQFYSDFDFALTTILLQARADQKLRFKMLSVLKNIIDISRRTKICQSNTAYFVAYSTCLSSKEITEFNEFISNYIDWEGEIEQLIFSKIMQHTENSATLLVAVLSCIFVQSNYEKELISILQLLTPAIDAYPNVFSYTNHIFSEKIFQILSITQNTILQKAALQIAHFMLKEDSKQKINYLDTIGFKGLIKMITKPTQRQEIIDRGKIIGKVLLYFL